MVLVVTSKPDFGLCFSSDWGYVHPSDVRSLDLLTTADPKETLMKIKLMLAVVLVVVLATAFVSQAQHYRAKDPGVRGGATGAGGMIPGLTAGQQAYFAVGQAEFSDAEGVGDGLGPRFNLDSCQGCHVQPAAGGSSPAVNPQLAVATAFGARNRIPSFITLNGPVREARFLFNPDGTRDGGVHALFVISGRKDGSGDAGACTAVQEDFEKQVINQNIVFRIPTPAFGLGLVEMIPDSTIRANLAANSSLKRPLGIRSKFNFINVSGTANNNGNDGTISRFGWKAQNKSLMLFAGEAYNVEMGISNELFQSERDENPTCQFATVPNDFTNTETSVPTDGMSAMEKFVFFMRFLAPPTPVTEYLSTNVGFVTPSSIANGRRVFAAIGCALCHTPTLRTGNATISALANQDVNLYSDLGVHAMGPGLADNVQQGQAAGDEFRSAPLWGLGQRIFFLHDGRTADLLEAIQAHASLGNQKFGPSEANRVISNFSTLRESDKQDLLNFLRSL
jgi:CxxC motif-containing protein (DUF1111 family)